MIKYQSIIDYIDCINLWNREVGFIYPITPEVFKQNVLNYQSKIAYGAYNDNELVGFIIGKTFESPILSSYNNKAWISLFYVSHKYRRQGIGSKLLTMLEDNFNDKEEIFVGKDINNFFPGVPTDFINLTDNFLLKRGYEGNKYTHDLINYNPQYYPTRNQDCEYVVGTIEIKDQLLKFLEKNFPGRWYYDAYDYFRNGGNGTSYALIKKNNAIIAFARINDRHEKIYPYNVTWYKRFKNLGGIGPLGVDIDERGKGFGYDIVAHAINILKNRNIVEMIIDWTGILEFYQKFNFEVWKNFKYMSKKNTKTLAK